MFSELNRILSNWIAVALLAVMFILMAGSVIGDSATTDEQAHIPAGYSYLSQRDYRLNPEHPPLIKDLSAVIPYFTFKPNFPTDVKAWTTDLNGQWDMGRIFLYESGNNPDLILFTTRFPMMLLAILFGWLFFVWVRSRYGSRVALLALFFFAFSPTFIAHSRYVTTDLAAAFAFFIGIATFVAFLERSTWKRTLLAGAALGIALLLKFSTALLLPLYFMYAVLWVFISAWTLDFQVRWFHAIRDAATAFAKLIPKFILLFAIAAGVIWAVYAFHIMHYPQARQIADSTEFLKTYGFRPVVNLTLGMAGVPVLRPFGEYLVGLLMVIQRGVGGNTTYFLGDLTNTGWWYYFPVAFLLKESLAFLILMAAALIIAGRFIYLDVGLPSRWSLRPVIEWMRDNFTLTASVLFIAVYWYKSMSSPLNIGVRHVLPTFPFIYLLVAREIIRGLSSNTYPDPHTMREWLITIWRRSINAAPRYLALGALLLWMALSTVIAFPHYLSYYNALAGGSANGYKYIVDSNYDWGQDLKRLASFVEKNHIQKIGVDYFGGGSPSYYMGSKFVPWWSAKGAPNPNVGDPEWLAVSASTLEGAEARPIRGFTKNPVDSYPWLTGAEPVARAGYSIFIYHLK